MDFEKKYELLEPISGQGASSYKGRQLASGEDVTVHLLRGDRVGYESLLSRVRRLPPESLGQVIEVGEQEGTLYLVTTAPPYRHFSEWLPEQERLASAEPGEFTRFFQRPPERSSQSALGPAADSPGPGEFTRLFAPAIAPTRTDEHQFIPPMSSQPPGEYTRVIAQSLVSPRPQLDETSPASEAVHQIPEATPAPAARRTVSLMVALLLCLISFLAGGTLVFLMLRH